MAIIMMLAGVHARTFHVSPNGDDANPGTPESPLRTMQKAAEVARAGDTVLVRGGVYRGHLFLRFSGEPDNEHSNKEHGIYATGTDFEIINNVIHSNRAYGIQVAGYPFDADRHAGPEFATARRWLIRHNTIAFQQNRAGIVIWQPDTTDCVIENNILYRNAATLGTGDCQGIDFVVPGGQHIIRNNLFYGPERKSIGDGPRDCTLSENLEDKDPLFVDPDRFDFRLRQGSPAMDPNGAQTAGAPLSVGQATPP